MNNIMVVIISIVVLFVATSVHAYTVTVNNSSSKKIQVTVAAYYIVTSKDHLTMFVDPHTTAKGDMGGLLSSGWRVVAEHCSTICYNDPFFSQPAVASFTINIFDDGKCILTSWRADVSGAFDDRKLCYHK